MNDTNIFNYVIPVYRFQMPEWLFKLRRFWKPQLVFCSERKFQVLRTGFYQTLAAKLEVLNEQYSKQNEHRRKIWRIVFAVILVVSAASLVRYVFFFGSIYQMKSIGDASTSVTVIGGADVPVYIPIWYYFSVLKPVLLSALAAVVSVIGLYRTRKK